MRRIVPWRRALAWLALLAPLFYISYGLANWWAGQQVDVPSVVFAWEHSVPFWEWTIFPYWSINVFYAVSLFLARAPHEMDRHAARLLTAQAIAVVCFVAWPLQFSFGQPPASGLSGLLFDALRSFDQPFNQAPSLHIALAVILWDWYRRLIRPLWAQWLAHIWAFAICASVLTTWQHHFIDIPTGALLGLVCVWLWPLERQISLLGSWRLTRDPQRWKLALCYATGSGFSLAAALWLGGVGLWLAWPAASLMLVALIYLGFGPRGFRMNRHAQMHWSGRWLFAPYQLAARLNAYLWTRKLPAGNQVAPGLWLGRRPSVSEWQAAGRPQLVSLCAELPLPAELATSCRAVPMLDLVRPPPQGLRRAGLQIEYLRRSQPNTPVWVCCALGFSRSAQTTLAWLTQHAGLGLEEALLRVRKARPQVVLDIPTPKTTAASPHSHDA